MLFSSQRGFPSGSAGNPPAKAEYSGWSPGRGRSPGGGNGNPLQHSCLENTMDRGAWRATVRGVAQSRTRLRDRVPIHGQSLGLSTAQNPAWN